MLSTRLGALTATLVLVLASACTDPGAAAPTASGAAPATNAAPAPALTANAAPADTAAATQAEELGIQPRPFGQIVETVQGSRGQVVFFHLYASWCGPCRHEFPDIVQLAKRYRSQGLKLVAVSVDEQRGDLEEFLRPYNADIVFPAYLMIGPEQEFRRGLRTLGANFQGGIPYTAVYDRNGKLVTEWTGSRDMEHFERVVRPLL